jgi:hypothetical protein
MVAIPLSVLLVQSGTPQSLKERVYLEECILDLHNKHWPYSRPASHFFSEKRGLHMTAQGCLDDSAASWAHELVDQKCYCKPRPASPVEKPEPRHAQNKQNDLLEAGVVM